MRNALQIGEDTEGGYLCPDEFERKLISALEEENVFRPLATKIQTSSGDRYYAEGRSNVDGGGRGLYTLR